MTSRQRERTYLCQCTHRGCVKAVDHDTGQNGVRLPLRTYKLHQKSQLHADKRNELTLQLQAELEERAVEAKARALKELETTMAKAVENLSVNNQGQPKSEEDPDFLQYRVDMVRAKIRQISKVQDDIDRLQLEFEMIGSPTPATAVPDVLISESLERCDKLKAYASELERELNMSDRGTCRGNASVKEMRKRTQENLSSFQQQLATACTSWKDVLKQRDAQIQRDLDNGIELFESDHYFQPLLQGAPAIIQLVLFMVVVCHLVFGFPRRGSWWILSMTEQIIQTIVQLTLKMVGQPVAKLLQGYFAGILSGFPKDVRTARDQFHLEAEATVYAVCPRCHATHKASSTSNIPSFPEKCSAKRYGKRCREILIRPKMKGDTQIYVPIKAYVAFEFKDWLAGMLSRKGYEQMMDEAWSRMGPSPDGSIKDIFQGSVVRDFKGPDKLTHFSQTGEKNAGRYLFSLGCDFFNPLRNLAGGKKVSVGMIALVCLNLPIPLRYQPENIFLAGVIPGPQEPSLDAINPYLRPVVDAFLELWTGIRFSKTFLHALGRLIFCAIIAVIADLPAARKVGGFASFKHEYYCSVCWCNRTVKPYNDHAYGSWRLRTGDQCRVFAKAYASATSPEEANESFDRSGVRSSELLRLPYYDPVKHLVIDPMHNLFLGLIKEHFQNILGYNPKSRTSSKENEPEFRLGINIQEDEKNPLPDNKEQRRGIRVLLGFLSLPLGFDPSDAAAIKAAVDDLVLRKISLQSLIFVARGLGLPVNDVDDEGYEDNRPDGRYRSDNADSSTQDAILSPPPLQEEGTTKKSSGQKTRKRDAQRRRATLRKEVASLLISWRVSQKEPPPSPLSGKRGCVFAADEMEAIWQDIERTVKPSWTTSVPTTVSSAGPKLKSDQWRMFGSLYLPITLIRLWSECPDDETGQERRSLLRLTMSLLSAIAVATSRETSVSHAAEYLKYMLQYRKELEAIFPAYECHANHHVAMHLGELLIMYGPMHGWWTFPFERMIGTLQRIPTNYKAGEYEETIGRSWYRTSNLRALFSRITCPQPIEMCKELFMMLIRPDQRNSLATDSPLLSVGSLDDNTISLDTDDDHDIADVAQPGELSKDVREALLQYHSETSIAKAQSLARLTLSDGRRVTTHLIHEGNSCVLSEGSNLPYRVENIVQLPQKSPSDDKHANTWLIVRWHKALRIADPYQVYPRLRAKIWSTELEAELGIIPVSRVQAHYAKCIIPFRNQQALVVVSLSHVHSLRN